MAAPKIRAIIFDIGRVLVRVDISRSMAGLSEGLALSPQEVWSAIENDPRWIDWQEGRISPRDWHLHLGKRLGGTLSFADFTATWNRALDHQPIQDTAFLEKLGKRYKLALLSNTDPIHVAHLESTYDFFPFFPRRVYSCSVGASKPNPLIYREALTACKVQADEAIYIDDVPAYAEAAQKLGMTGIVFRSPAQLAEDLEKLGIDVS